MWDRFRFTLFATVAMSLQPISGAPAESPAAVVLKYVEAYDKWEVEAHKANGPGGGFAEQRLRQEEWEALHKHYCLTEAIFCMVSSPGVHAAKEEVIGGSRSTVRTRTPGSHGDPHEWIYEMELVGGRWMFTRITTIWDDFPDEPLVFLGELPEED